MDNLLAPIGAFNNQLPVKIRFGEGISDTLPEVIKEVDSKKVFLMVDEGIEKFNPAAAEIGRAHV